MKWIRLVAANRDDIVNMLRSEKHRSRKRRTFAMPNRGFDVEPSDIEPDDEGRPEDEAASLALLENFVW